MSDWLDKTLRIHLAGYFIGGAGQYDVGDYPYLLESYHYVEAQRHVDAIRAKGRKVFLDSGAFSMWSKGVSVDLPRYAEYIKRNHDIIEVASVLDGIGDPALTLENQKKLEDLGVEVLPCFHYGEPLHYLEHYLENYDHITLGGMVPISTPDLRVWLDSIWDSHLTDENGIPRVKVHGFGLTVLDLMKRYPWYSVDSTSYVLTSRFGSIYWPLPDGRETKLVISDQSPKTREHGMHYDTMSPKEQEVIREQIEAKGFDVEELRSIYWKRDLWNIQYFRDLCDQPLTPFHKKEQGLF